MANLKKIIRETLNKVLAEDERAFIQSDDFEPMTYDYLFRMHKGLPKEYFAPSNIPYDPNEYVISLEKCKVGLVEGLIKTYPTEKTLNFVCKNLAANGYDIQPKHFRMNCPNDDKTIYGHVNFMIKLNSLNKEIDDILKKSFAACGYHLGITYNRVDNQNEKCLIYQFEPKFQENVTNNQLGEFLYHITTENAAKKIMQQGLCPSNRTKNGFQYDGRCYFFTIYDKTLFEQYMNEANKQNITGNNTFNQDFVIITIDRKKLNNVDFFTDPNFNAKIAAFTYSNIPPNAIVKTEKL